MLVRWGQEGFMGVWGGGGGTGDGGFEPDGYTESGQGDGVKLSGLVVNP